MSSENPFLWNIDQYKRDIGIRRGYVQQVAKYLSLQLGKPYSDCLKYVIAKMKADRGVKFKDPTMLQLRRVRAGERVKDETTFLTYVEDIEHTGRIVSPSLVVYERPEVEKSVTAEWQDDNIKARKKSKNAMFELQQLGELMLAALADYDQNARKIRINSVSGMRGFEGNPLFLATGHSSLTSLCRAAAGYGNATVERFLAGSKHFHSPEIAKANLVAVLTIEDHSRIAAVMEEYNLVYPSVLDVMEMVHRSSDLYWKIPEESQIILGMVSGMTPLERAVVCYSGDLYHLAKLNPHVVREMMTDMIDVDVANDPDYDTGAELKSLDSTEKAYVSALCSDVLMGTTLNEVKENDAAGYAKIGKVAGKFKSNRKKYYTLINAIFAPKHLPPTVASLKSIQRRVCLAADTDSSIFTTEYWVHWYCGHLKRGPVEDRIWYLATYMVCECIAHSLAMLSANVGVDPLETFRLAMKNEYAFPEFALTNLAKHYFSTMSMREGNVYDALVMETKGVELRGSTSTKTILDAQAEMMKNILHTVDRGEKLVARELLEEVAKYELDTIRSIKAGEYTYLRSAQIKPDSNKMPYHELWETVFAPKYGASIAPPYPAVKVTTELVNKTAMREWLEAIEDKELAIRMGDWLDKYNRKDLKTIYLPTLAIKGRGLPLEIQDAANVRKLAFQINTGFYRILESTGLNIVDRNHHRLVHEFLEIAA